MKIIEKQKALDLRRKGFTISEIQKIIPVSKSSISLWVENIQLTKNAQKRISGKITLGQIKSRQILREKALLRKKDIEIFAKKFVEKIKFTKELKTILCACLYECEGGKGVHQSLSFTNSDPKLVKYFLDLFRESFNIDESKFSVCLHLHRYHNRSKQLKFWSRITNIPLSNFIKPYIKNNSGLYKKEGYQGCVNIRYFDISIKRKLMNIFKEITVSL